MDIAGLSMVKSQSQLMNQVSTSVLSKSLDTQETLGDSMIKMMKSSVQPDLGQNIDVRV